MVERFRVDHILIGPFRTNRKNKQSHGTKMGNRINDLLILLVLVVFAMGLYGFSQPTINWVIDLFVSAIIGTAFSAVAGSFVESITRDRLKGIFFTVKILGFRLSPSLFTIVTFVVYLYLRYGLQ